MKEEFCFYLIVAGIFLMASGVGLQAYELYTRPREIYLWTKVNERGETIEYGQSYVHPWKR